MATTENKYKNKKPAIPKTVTLAPKKTTYIKSSNKVRIYWKPLDTKTYKFLQGYKIDIRYTTMSSGTIFSAGIETNVSMYSTEGAYKYYDYDVPDNAYKVYYRIFPVCSIKTNDSKWDTKAYYECQKWYGQWTSTNSTTSSIKNDWPSVEVYQDLKPNVPGAPTIEISDDNYKVTVYVDYDDRTAVEGLEVTHIGFRVQDLNLPLNNCIIVGPLTSNAGIALLRPQARRATYEFQGTPGHKYRACCRAIAVATGKYATIHGSKEINSDWSSYSGDSENVKPGAVSSELKVTALSSTSVRCEYGKADGSESYEIEYTDHKEYFDTSSVSSTTSKTTTCIITGLQTGSEWFFRVRAINSKGESKWSDIVSIVLGRAPAAPTTWSNTTTAKIGEEITLYWVHNSQDSSSQVKGEVMIYRNGSEFIHQEVENTTDEYEKDKTSYLIFSTSGLTDGDVLTWKVRTCGVTGEYGDWSVVRTIELFIPPTISLLYSNTKKWYWDPFNFTKDDIYSAAGEMGESFEYLTAFPIHIQAYTSPSSQTPLSYTLKVISDSDYEMVDYTGELGLVFTGQELLSRNFDTSKQLFTTITPSDVSLVNGHPYTVEVTVAMSSGLSASASFSFWTAFETSKYTPSLDFSYDPESYEAYLLPYCVDENDELIDDVYLSMYRINYDGSFTELSSDILNTKLVTFPDVHPSLGITRYRVVARSRSSGIIAYEDFAYEDLFDPTIIIQWNQRSNGFIGSREDYENVIFTSTLRLPYNIDISESNDRDVTLVNYIGRSNPVGYYGTQLGVSATWNTDIPKDDTETLYMLRQLAVYQGNVYVREPSGIGYWAKVDVSLNIKHLNLVIPVTLTIKKVEA